MSMGPFIRYITRRLLMLMFVLIGISFITFIVARVVLQVISAPAPNRSRSR